MITWLGLVVLLLPALLLGSSMWNPSLQPWAAISIPAVLVLLVADHLLSRYLTHIEAKREVAEKLSVGAANTVTIEVTNHSRTSLRLTIKDDPPAEFDTDRRQHSLRLQAGRSARISYETTPAARGDYSFGDIHIRALSLLGLTWCQYTVAASATVAVYPDVTEIARYEELARADALQAAGFHTIRHRGAGTEFESLRDYVPDDEFRHIDWKATARRHRPITRQYQAERSQGLLIMIDSGRMMAASAGAMSKLDHAINAALMLSYVATQWDDQIGLLTFSEQVHAFLPPRKGRAQIGRISDALYALPASLHEPDYWLAFNTLFSRSRRRSLVVCFTDLIDRDASERLLSGMASLYPRHLPLLVAVQDPDLQAASGQYPTEAFDTYEKAVALHAIESRQEALTTVSRSGVLVLDAPPEELTIRTVNRYLQIKQKHAL
ncbi:MAG: DUF58 domain-containing protein [Armatimonadota bacterium]